MTSVAAKLHSLFKPGIVWLMLSFLPFLGQTQLNCTTTHAGDSIITRCFHRNRRVSTIESWDKERRWGSMQAFDSGGNEILHYALRRFAGHSSVTLHYYPNGQVHKAYYSSAPDGGIQFYRINHEFNEQGEQISYTDFSQPDGRPVLIIPRDNHQMPDVRLHPVKDPPPPVQEDELNEPEPEPAMCAVPYQTVFKVINETKRAIIVDLAPLYTQWAYLKPHHNMVIPARSGLYVDSVIVAERFLPITETYTVEARFRRSKRPLRVIVALPHEQELRRVYIWHVVR